MDNGNQYLKKKIILMFKKFHSAMCEDSNFDGWMTINDVNMASWVQLWWSYIVVENEMFW